MQTGYNIEGMHIFQYEGAVCVIDCDEESRASLTNRSERMVELCGIGGFLSRKDYKPLLYCDSTGCWDRVSYRSLPQGGFEFLEFVVYRAATLRDALTEYEVREG